MAYRVRVEGPSASRSFGGGDLYKVERPTDITDHDGVLIILLPPYAGRPGLKLGEDPDRPGVSYPARKATGPSQVVYPRGGWHKVTIVELLDDNSVPNPTL
jgi:hypothetical protein